ncbi:RNA-directed DNA polymerase, eukaryota, reverse transcriptase zinc-binding domain protein [Tanacetum coccineum]
MLIRSSIIPASGLHPFVKKFAIQRLLVADTICDGEWRWPGEWVDRFDAIFAIDPPNIDNDRKDKVVWGNGRGRCCNFSVSNVWEDLRIRSQIVPWASLVWFSQCILRHFFMMWLVVHKILKTHDTMGVWEKKVDMVPLISNLRRPCQVMIHASLR